MENIPMCYANDLTAATITYPPYTLQSVRYTCYNIIKPEESNHNHIAHNPPCQLCT